MSSFQTALNAVFPLISMMALGVLLRKIGMTDRTTLSRMNKVVITVFFATSVYYNIITADLATLFNGRLLVTAVIIQMILVAVALEIAFLSERTRKRRGAMAHCIFHTNFVLFSSLLGSALCGEGNVASISLLVATVVPLQNILSVIVLELFRENSHITAKKVFGGVLKNPFVVAAILGFATQLLQLHFPTLIMNQLRDLSRCGTPVALIIMGGLFDFGAIGANLRSIIIGVVSRLILVPALLLPLLIRSGFQGADFVGPLCVLIAPCANSSFALACTMDSDTDLTSQRIVFSSIASLGTIFGWVYLLSCLGLV